jgi:hypothetical protein
MNSFVDSYINRDKRYSLGTETASGRRYVSIPVSNSMVDYEEYYVISEDEFVEFAKNEAFALDFVNRCRKRLMDDRLILRPGSDRGAPV